MPNRLQATALRDFIETLFAAHGVAAAPAKAVARHMVWSEMVGRLNYGLERIPIHLKRLERGVLESRDLTSYRRVSDSAGHLDGGGGFGQYAAELAMDHAIALARDTGVGVVAVSNSNSFGAGAYYINRAAEAGMIGIAASNSFPKVAPFGGLRPVLGTNPFAFGAPRRDGRHLLVDMATSATSGSKVVSKVAKGEPIPPGVAIDSSGQPVTDPARMAGAVLLPFGGAKGFGLGLMVEILSGVITGAGVGNGVASLFNDFTRSGNNGHFLMALDIARFIGMEDYHARLEGLIAMIKAAGDGVLLPGEIRWRNYEDAERNGIAVDPGHWQTAVKLAEAAGVKVPDRTAGGPA